MVETTIGQNGTVAQNQDYAADPRLRLMPVLRPNPTNRVPVTTVRYSGVIHDFGLFNALANIPQTRSLLVQAAAELRKYLRSETPAGKN